MLTKVAAVDVAAFAAVDVAATKKPQKTGVIVQIRKPFEVSASFDLARMKIPRVMRKCMSSILREICFNFVLKMVTFSK